MVEQVVCAECHKPIEGNHYSVNQRKYHAECFKCETCGHFIPGSYGFYNDKRMCESCIDEAYEADLPRCGVCQQAIPGIAVTLGGETFHKSCLTCRGCGVELHDKTVFVNEEGERVCKACIPARVCAACNRDIEEEATRSEGLLYHHDCFRQQDVAEHSCFKCSKPIASTEQVVIVEDVRFHIACFTCAKCQGFMSQYFMQNGDMVCQNCVESHVCKRCQEPIQDTMITAYGQTYHTRCFRCQRSGCGADLANGFFAYPDALVCNSCNSLRADEEVLPGCRKCGDLIKGTAVVPFGREGEVYHSWCFCCEVCGESLEKYNDGEAKWSCKGSKYQCPDCTIPAALPPIAEESDSTTVEEKSQPTFVEKKKDGPTTVQEKRQPKKKLRPCLKCGRHVSDGPNFMGLRDGRFVHASCFKCCAPRCGAQFKPSLKDRGTLRAKADALKAGRYLCERCVGETKSPAVRVNSSKRKTLRMPLGAYLGKGFSPSEEGTVEDIYTLKLQAGTKFWIGRSSSLDERSWEIEGLYGEEGDTKDQLVKVLLTVVNTVGRCPHLPGEVLPLFVEEGEPHKTLVYDEIHFQFQKGINETDLRRKSRPAPVLSVQVSFVVSPSN